MAIVVVEAVARLDAQRPGPLQGVGRQKRAGDVFLAVDTIRVAGQRVDAFRKFKGKSVSLHWELMFTRSLFQTAHGFFQALGDSVITGPTLTNVND